VVTRKEIRELLAAVGCPMKAEEIAILLSRKTGNAYTRGDVNRVLYSMLYEHTAMKDNANCWRLEKRYCLVCQKEIEARGTALKSHFCSEQHLDVFLTYRDSTPIHVELEDRWHWTSTKLDYGHRMMKCDYPVMTIP